MDLSQALLIFMLFAAPCYAFNLEEMTVDEKIGQLFVAAAYPSLDAARMECAEEYSFDSVEELLIAYHIGGVIFKHFWEVDNQSKLISDLQSKTRIPLFILQDGEWGLSMRLKESVRFPKNTTLGAIQDNALLYAMGNEIAKQYRQIGVNFNLSPVVDINSNPKNPVIGMRSFGDDPQIVAEKGIAMMRGLQDGGIISCAKHFPGHGDTDQDSHTTLPIISGDYYHLEQVELYPFKRLIQAGVKSVMTAHLEVPALEKRIGLPATLSKSIITDLLREQFQFDGIIITDDLIMQGIAAKQTPAESALEALLAGNDLLLASNAIPQAFERIKQAYEEGIVTDEILNDRVKRILTAKQWLQKQSPIDVLEDLSGSSLALKRVLYRNSISILSDKFAMHALHIDRTKDVFIIAGENSLQPFFNAFPSLIVPKIVSKDQFLNGAYPSAFLLVANSKDYAEAIAIATDANIREKEVKIIAFCSPYPLLPYIHQFPILMAYEDDEDAQEAAADVLFNKLQPVYRKFHSTHK